MEKTFKIRITICNMAEVFGLGLLSVAIGMLLYYNFFEPKQFNSYQLIMRGSLCVAIPFITLYLITLREIRLEIKNEELYFYKNSKLFYRDNIQNLYSIRGLNTSIDKTRMIILNFERKKILLYSPVNIDFLFKKDDSIKDVFRFIINKYKFRKKKVYGHFLFVGKPFENRQVVEYWNPNYINRNPQYLK